MADLSLLFSRATPRFARDSRFDAIDADQAAQDAIPLTTATAPPPPDPLTQARDEGFTAGLAVGRAEALAQADAERRTTDKLTFTFACFDAERTENLRQHLLDTVIALCEATLAPLALDLPALARRVERAAAMFARADDERVIRLNPNDLACVQPLLPADWTFLADPALPPGALRIETRNGGAEDGPEQWRRAIAEALSLC